LRATLVGQRRVHETTIFLRAVEPDRIAMFRRTIRGCFGLLLLCGSAACSGEEVEGTGSLSVLLEAEDVIIDGLDPGDEAENIRDGWSVRFDKFIATIGDIDVHFATDQAIEAEGEDVFVIDLTELPAGGTPLWRLDDLRAGRWEFHYGTPGAAHASTRHDSVAQADYDEMVDNDWTYLLDGSIENADGQACPPAALASTSHATPNGNMSGGNPCFDASSVRFQFGATAETSFGPCEIDGVPGFAVASGSEQTVAITIHGDHPFFNGFPESNEGGVMRLAQWLADCDLDLDGTVTRAELEAITPSMLPELDERYQLGGSPITPLTNMYEYLVGQLKTQGHFEGEGECPWDGTVHAH
jgi:hypothetical protein